MSPIFHLCPTNHWIGAVINSTYQSNDLSGTEEDVLYQSDASFSAKLDNSYSHNNKQSYNKSVSNGDNSQSSSSVNNLNRNSKSSRYNKSSNVKNVNNKQSNVKPLKRANTSKGVTKQTTSSDSAGDGDGGTNKNLLQFDDDKRNVDFYNTIIDWNQNIDTNQHPDTESTSDNDNNDYSYNYNGNDAPSGWLTFITIVCIPMNVIHFLHTNLYHFQNFPSTLFRIEFLRRIHACIPCMRKFFLKSTKITWNSKSTIFG